MLWACFLSLADVPNGTVVALPLVFRVGDLVLLCPVTQTSC
jgi:hypothetical protein